MYIPSDTLFYLTKDIQIKTKMTYFGSFLKVAIARISKSVKKTICMEIQKTSNSQSNLKKEEWNWRNQSA